MALMIGTAACRDRSALVCARHLFFRFRLTEHFLARQSATTIGKARVRVGHCRPLSPTPDQRFVLLFTVAQICCHGLGNEALSGLLSFELVGDVAEGFTAIIAVPHCPVRWSHYGKRHHLSSKPTPVFHPLDRDKRSARVHRDVDRIGVALSRSLPS
jgi:hypothetical protein